MTPKRRLILACFMLAAALLTGAYYCQNQFWQAVGINSATSFMSIGVALLFVNVYLERKARQGAVKSLLILAHSSMADFHNTFLDTCWAKFGRDEWGKISNEYVRSNGKPQALRHEVRDFLYKTVSENTATIQKLEKLDESFTELSRMVGWDLDPHLLKAILDTRIAVNAIREIGHDDSDESKDAATEHLMDADIHSQDARHYMMKLAGIADDD